MSIEVRKAFSGKERCHQGIFPEGFILNQDYREDNSDLILANLLAKKGFDISVVDLAVDDMHHSKVLKGYVAIHGGKNSSKVFWDIVLKSPEYRSIRSATLTSTTEGEPKVNETTWDLITRFKIKTLYWDNTARQFKEWAERNKNEGNLTSYSHWISREIDALGKVSKGLQIPTVQEVITLAEDIVDKTIDPYHISKPTRVGRLFRLSK